MLREELGLALVAEFFLSYWSHFDPIIHASAALLGPANTGPAQSQLPFNKYLDI